VGESPLWYPRSRRLWWIDIYGPTVQAYDPLTGVHSRFAAPFKTIGNIVLRRSGGFVAATNCGLVPFDPEMGWGEVLCNPEPDVAGNRMNDGKCDRQGRLWVGTMSDPVLARGGTLYRIDPDCTTTPFERELIIPNSIAFSPDAKTMYFGDSRQFTIWAFDLDLAEGLISNRRVFRDLRGHPGRPDGSTVDEQGYLWNSEIGGGRVVRYTPGGEIDRIVPLPVSHPTCCAFGGPDLDTLYITSATQMLDDEARRAQPHAGGLFAVPVGIKGLQEPSFAG
jgi:sugar lactone lactonase YvrE